MFLNMAGMVSIINSVLIATFAGGALSLLKTPLIMTALPATAVFLLIVGAHMRHQEQAWSQFDRRYPPLFPSDP